MNILKMGSFNKIIMIKIIYLINQKINNQRFIKIQILIIAKFIIRFKAKLILINSNKIMIKKQITLNNIKIKIQTLIYQEMELPTELFNQV